MAWIIEENKLDTQQRDFLDNVDINRKNIWIKGFAGSGKSILLGNYSAIDIVTNDGFQGVIGVILKVLDGIYKQKESKHIYFCLFYSNH